MDHGGQCGVQKIVLRATCKAAPQFGMDHGAFSEPPNLVVSNLVLAVCNLP